MPLPVTPWTADTPITAKSLNLALYTIDGTLNKPQGILLHAQRPMSLEVIGAAGANLLFTTSPTGHRNIISQSGDTEAAVTILDSAGYYGQSTDGVYWISGYVFTPAVIGTRGDGVTPGGWTIICHFIPIQNNVSTTTTAIGADLDESGTVVCSGARQKLAEQNDACAFFLDLQNATGVTFQPSVTIADSSSTAAVPRFNGTDSSGETPRFFTIWAWISDFGLSPGYGQPAIPAPYAGPYTSATTIGTTGSDDVDVNGVGRDHRAGELPVQPADLPGQQTVVPVDRQQHPRRGRPQRDRRRGQLLRVDRVHHLHDPAGRPVPDPRDRAVHRGHHRHPAVRHPGQRRHHLLGSRLQRPPGRRNDRVQDADLLVPGRRHDPV